MKLSLLIILLRVSFSRLQWTEQPENIPTALAIIPNRSKGAEGKHVGKVLKKGECEFW